MAQAYGDGDEDGMDRWSGLVATDHIISMIHPENASSVRVAEKIGEHLRTVRKCVYSGFIAVSLVLVPAGNAPAGTRSVSGSVRTARSAPSG